MLPPGLDPAAVGAVFVDLDGTLLDDHEPLATAAPAIAALEASGVPVVIATGRMFVSSRRLARRLGVTRPVVCYQGALVGEVETGRVLRHETVPASLAREVVAAFDAEAIHVNVFVDDALYVAEENAWARRYADGAQVPINAVGDLGAWLAAPVTKIVATDTPERLDAVKPAILEAFGARAFVAKSLPHFLEIAAPGVSKATGAQVMADRLGVDAARCVAVGDGENDLELLEWAGYAIAVGGGFPALLEGADWVTPPLDEDGPPRALQAIARARSGRGA